MYSAKSSTNSITVTQTSNGRQSLNTSNQTSSHKVRCSVKYYTQAPSIYTTNKGGIPRARAGRARPGVRAEAGRGRGYLVQKPDGEGDTSCRSRTGKEVPRARAEPRGRYFVQKPDGEGDTSCKGRAAGEILRAEAGRGRGYLVQKPSRTHTDKQRDRTQDMHT